MALKAVVDKIEDVDEKYRDLYVEKNGKFEITGIEGIKTEADVQRVQEGAAKERKEHKATKERYAALGDRKVEDIVAMLDKYPELEAAAAGKIDEKKIEEMVEGRIKGKLSPLERKVADQDKALKERDTQIETYKQHEVTRTIHDEVRGAVAKSQGFSQTAVEDALLFADRVFTVTDDGKVMTKDGVPGVNGGMDAAVWLTEMQQRKPHWWGPSQGGGGRGNNGVNGGGSNPFSHAEWNMTAQAALVATNPTRADQMARSAGTTVGGQKPPPPSK